MNRYVAYVTAIAVSGLLLAGSAAATPLIRVPADPGWTATGVTLDAGSTYSLHVGGQAITAPASVFAPFPGGFGGVSGPEGQPFTCVDFTGGTCLLDGAPFGALIGRIGDGTPFVIGAATVLHAQASGLLFLAVNDYLEFDDNQGGFSVHISLAS